MRNRYFGNFRGLGVKYYNCLLVYIHNNVYQFAFNNMLSILKVVILILR